MKCRTNAEPVSAAPPHPLRTTVTSNIFSSVFIYKGETITVRCEIHGGDTEWDYEWETNSIRKPPNQNEHRIGSASSFNSGKYRCKGRMKSSQHETTEWSDSVTLTPTVTLQPSWTQIYSGETVTVRCEIQGGEGAQWTYEWSPAKLNTPPTSNEYRIITVTESDSGGYSCRGTRNYLLTEWSDTITLTVSSKPKAELRADRTAVPVGGSVTLTCSVNPSSSSSSSSSSSGWKYYWYRDGKSSESMTNGQISVSEGGRYSCRGGKGEPVYYTEYSESVWIDKIALHLMVTEPFVIHVFLLYFLEH
uniref:Ig-like domain-containing protein n=1 Tax=Neolamprologus brichardi TaxID=32507 RepID=A0A3Q4I2S8_NEOBR